MSQPETETYLWTDRVGRAYVSLRFRAGHWRVEWGQRDPPGGDNYLEQGKHESSERDDAIRRMLDNVRALSDEPDADVERVAAKLREAVPPED